jgi:hypothetical protein
MGELLNTALLCPNCKTEDSLTLSFRTIYQPIENDVYDCRVCKRSFIWKIIERTNRERIIEEARNQLPTPGRYRYSVAEVNVPDRLPVRPVRSLTPKWKPLSTLRFRKEEFAKPYSDKSAYEGYSFTTHWEWILDAGGDFELARPEER